MYEIEICDYTNPAHLDALAGLLQEYMADPMGDHDPHSKLEQLRLVDGLANHPSSVVFLLGDGEKYLAMATCFVLFSTFNVRSFINIHDFIVTPTCREKGIGSTLMSFIKQYAKDKKYCKVTLEVREDNLKAQGLYKKMGFNSCTPEMLYWNTKIE
ncbi:MAG: GNAT family N-acetyltransferase [Rikenellaceae bacterium]